MKKHITLLDGATGTALWELAEKNGIEKVPVWIYNVEHPELVRSVADVYIQAGSEILYANTFSANAPTVARASSLDPDEVVRAGVRILREAVEGTDVKVALSIGPLPQLMEPWGDLTEEEAQEIFQRQIDAGMEEHPDLIVFETFIDLEMLKVAVKAAKRYDIPVFCTMTFEKVGKTLFGNSVEDMIEELTPLNVSAIGMNCSLGPTLAVPVIRQFVGKTDIPLIFKPNAGQPIVGADGRTTSDYTAEVFAREVAPALEFVDYIGGCCGTDPSYITELKKYM